MAHPSDSFEKVAWLIIATGGWWTPKEVWAQLPDRLSGVPVDLLTKRLWIMAHRNKTLASKRDPSKRCKDGYARYAVMPSCKVPMGLLVGDIVRAFALRSDE